MPAAAAAAAEAAKAIFGGADSGLNQATATGAPITVGGFAPPPFPGWARPRSQGALDLSDPVTAVWVGAGVLLVGALLLRAVR